MAPERGGLSDWEFALLRRWDPLSMPSDGVWVFRAVLGPRGTSPVRTPVRGDRCGPRLQRR